MPADVVAPLVGEDAAAFRRGEEDAAAMMSGLDGRVASTTHGDLTSYITVEDGKLITGTVQDCTPYIERAKERHLSGDHGSKDLKLAADIPDTVYLTYMAVQGIDYQELMTNPVHFKRMLNDPALKHLRIWPGRI